MKVFLDSPNLQIYNLQIYLLQIPGPGGELPRDVAAFEHDRQGEDAEGPKGVLRSLGGHRGRPGRPARRAPEQGMIYGYPVTQGCQMAIAKFFDCRRSALWTSSINPLCYAALPFLGLCPLHPPTGAIQGNEEIKFCHMATLPWHSI